MSTQREERIPPLTLGWRLKMALGDMKRDEMAALCEVDPGTISRWMADKGARPKRAYLITWAMATGVPLEWLEHGVEPQGDGPDPDGARAGDSAALARLTASKVSRSAGSSHNHRYVAARSNEMPTAA